MPYELSDLIDIEKCKGLLDSLCDAVGIAAAIIDLRGEVLIGARWQRICEDFHRANEETCKKCIESDTQLANELRRGKRFSMYQCPNGLTDAASPIIIEGEHVANVFVGQFLLKPPDREFFRQQADTYGFEETDYLEALSEVSIVSEDKLPAIFDFLTTFAEMLGQMGLERTKQMETEEALRESESKYRKLHESLMDAFVSVDMAGNILEFNNEYLRILGYPADEITRLRFFDITPEKWHEFEAGIVEEQILKRGYSDVYEKEYIKKDGTVIPVELRTFLIKDKEGSPAGMWAIVRDITNRKKAEEALQENELKFRSLFDLSLQAIALTDVETARILDVNDTFCELTKYSKKELLGKATTELGFYSAEDRKKFIDELASSGEVHGMEMDFRVKDGSILNALTFARVMKIAGKYIIMSVFLNITEQKRLEARIHESQRMEALGTLGGGIAHDFNNLLMGIQGRTSLMLMDLDSSHIHFEHLKGIEDYVKSASDLTKQLLAFARGGKYEVKPLDLNELIHINSSMFGRTKKEIKIHRKYQKGIWTIEGDRGQIDQVLMNLYVNAWQAMPSGGRLYLKTENVLLDKDSIRPFEIEPGRYVKVSVADTGVGMDEATRQRIFDPFFTTKEMGRGTGLGLASVYGIVKNHGGFIDVNTEKGKGTAFHIYLPVSEQKINEEKRSSNELMRGSETVLLVDDEEMIIEIGEQLLQKLGYEVFLARSGKEAIEIYGKNQDNIDIVILDMVMPDMSGGDTFDRLKKIKPDIKVLLSSGYSINGRATEILDRGCDGFIQKPFNMMRLSGKIREVLDKE